jgi:hypothetical protein
LIIIITAKRTSLNACLVVTWFFEQCV